MTLYPEAQKKAQEELDRVVGTERLPTHGKLLSFPVNVHVMTQVRSGQS